MISSPEPGTHGTLNDPLVIVGTFSTHTQASILAARLELAGIEACIPEQDASHVFSNVSPLVRVTVRVAAKDAEAAKALSDTTGTESHGAAADLGLSEKREHDPEKSNPEPTNCTWFEATTVIFVLMAVGAGAFAHFFRLTGPGAPLFWLWLLLTAACLLSGPYFRRTYHALGRACVIITVVQFISFLLLFAVSHSDETQEQGLRHEAIRNAHDW